MKHILSASGRSASYWNAGVVENLVQIQGEYPYSEIQNTPTPMKIVRESKSEYYRISPQMKIVRESKSEYYRIPPKMKIVRVQI